MYIYICIVLKNEYFNQVRGIVVAIVWKVAGNLLNSLSQLLRRLLVSL